MTNIPAYGRNIKHTTKRSAFNPYLPAWEYIPDGEPRLFDGRVYVYGSHDEAGGNGYCTGDYVCWSAPETDLGTWCFEGIIFRQTDDPTASDNTLRMFAPDVVQGHDGRYYLYYFLSDFQKIGVAVCDTPAGHYQFYGNIRFENGELLSKTSGYGMLFDPAVLSEPEGNWLYYGFGLQSHKPGASEESYKGGFAARLANDMLTIIGVPQRTIPGKLEADGTSFQGHAFLEASSIRHYGKQYYLIYSGENGHELCYATSLYPDRDFVYRGVIISNGDVGIHSDQEADAVYYLGNNHGGIVQLSDGRYFIFYHRHTHGIQFSRQGCAEQIQIAQDGSIAQAEITSCGLNGGPLPAKGEYSTHIACCLRSGQGILHYSSKIHWNEAHPYIAQESGISSVATLQNQYIYNLQDKAICGFKYFRFDGTEKLLRMRLRGTLNGEISVHCDKPDGPCIAKVLVVESTDWNWSETSLSPIRGNYALYFKFFGKGKCDFDAFRIY